MLLRSMSPQILAVDELGGKEDFAAVKQALCCGCRVLGTVHAGCVQELLDKPYLQACVTQKLFGRYILIERNSAGSAAPQSMMNGWSGYVKNHGKYPGLCRGGGDGRHIQRELADHLALCTRCGNFWWIFPATEMEPDSRWKFCWDALCERRMND